MNLLDNVAIVLVRPKRAENIGSAARSAANMGITRLIVVGDGLPDGEIMRKTATHHAAYMIDNIVLHGRLEDALAPFGWVVGSSARQGRQRLSMVSPRRMVDDLLPKLAENDTALVFGPEDCGLSNEDLQLCNVVTTIRTAEFSSLNLAQAVAVLSHELFYAVLQMQQNPIQPAAKLAQSRELEGMFTHVEQALRSMGQLKETDYAYWMRNIRHFFGRIEMRSRETKFIRGFCRQIMSCTGKLKER